MAVTDTLINKFGTMQGWNSITTNMMFRDIEGYTKIAYDDTVEKENVRGAGQYPVGRAVKGYSANCSVTLHKEEMDALMASIPPGKRIQDIAPFDITVIYERSDGTITKDIIHNCEFTDNGREVTSDDGMISREYALLPSHITWNAA